jgi:glycosyltransferase involved in cell wall biosynthesis
MDQHGVEFDVVVVDDGSSQDVGQTVAALADHRVRVIRHDHARGVSTARNHGAAEATGNWLAFCDDDAAGPTAEPCASIRLITYRRHATASPQRLWA